MIKREAQFTELFRHWINKYPPDRPTAYELKQTTTDSIPFSDVKEHQIDALMAVKWGDKGLLYKAPDDSRGIKPFDLFYMKGCPAFIVIKYPKLFVLIDIETFIEEKKRSKRKSLTVDRAVEIAWKVVNK
jgi:hypothetical protein